MLVCIWIQRIMVLDRDFASLTSRNFRKFAVQPHAEFYEMRQFLISILLTTNEIEFFNIFDKLIKLIKLEVDLAN